MNLETLFSEACLRLLAHQLTKISLDGGKSIYSHSTTFIKHNLHNGCHPRHHALRRVYETPLKYQLLQVHISTYNPTLVQG